MKAAWQTADSGNDSGKCGGAQRWLLSLTEVIHHLHCQSTGLLAALSDCSQSFILDKISSEQRGFSVQWGEPSMSSSLCWSKLSRYFSSFQISLDRQSLLPLPSSPIPRDLNIMWCNDNEIYTAQHCQPYNIYQVKVQHRYIFTYFHGPVNIEKSEGKVWNVPGWGGGKELFPLAVSL